MVLWPSYCHEPIEERHLYLVHPSFGSVKFVLGKCKFEWIGQKFVEQTNYVICGLLVII